MDLLEYLKEVAKYLDGWTAGRDSNWNFLSHNCGGRIYAKLYQQGQQKRISFSESWHFQDKYIGYYRPYDDQQSSKQYCITAKADTPPDKITRRLQKLIPEYLETYNLCLISHKKYEGNEEQKRKTLQELAKIVGSRVENWNGRIYHSWYNSTTSRHTPSLEVRGSSHDSFDIRLQSCNGEIAKQLLETLVNAVNEE